MAPFSFSEGEKGRKRRDSYYVTDINVATKFSIAGEKGRGNSKPYIEDKRVRRGDYERTRAYMLGKKVAEDKILC